MVFSILNSSLDKCGFNHRTEEVRKGVAKFLDLALFISMIVLPQFAFFTLTPAAHWAVTCGSALGFILLAYKNIKYVGDIN